MPRRVGQLVPRRAPDERLDYRVRVAPSLRRLEIELCPRGFGITRLNEPSPDAARLIDGEFSTSTRHVPASADRVELGARADECVQYAVKLTEKAGLASPDLWLWVPDPRPAGAPIRVRFELPEGVHAAMPWADGDVPETTFAWKAGGGFARRPLESLGPLELAWLAHGFEHEADVRAWVAQGERDASAFYGGFPVPRALVLLVPSDRRGAGFGMALRGGGPAVVMFLDRHSNAATLANDWTASHELLHLGVPRLPPEDAWLFEGLATYYTEIVRARAGLITPAQAYQHLLDGFERGRRSGGTLTLREESAAMRERHSYHRVYWAGAALALLTDLEARRAGGPMLDDALRTFAACCASSSDDWNAERVIAHLDATMGAARYASRARAWLDRAEFPELDSAWRELGIAPGLRGEARFTAAPSAPIRDAIVARLVAEPNREPHQAEQGGQDAEDQPRP